jgi:predicted MPP superfamily phosphohydrolase
MSLWFWILSIETGTYQGAFDSPANVWKLMLIAGILTAATIPRVIIIITHFVAKFLKLKTDWLTITGLATASVIFLIIAGGALFGRFNVKIDSVEIKIEGLHNDLDGLRIVQTGDLHLASFHHHKKKMSEFVDKINSLSPDIIINTGDFVSYGWREFDDFDTILSKAYGKYGKIAILGNHDFGTYHPHFTEAERRDNVLKMKQKIESSGYFILNDEHTIVEEGNAKIGVIGVVTMGRHPTISHGNIDAALKGLDKVDLKIALSHDPNHFAIAIEGKTDIDITLSGHTHGMQMGIMTKKFKWSPSKKFYPHWSGLYVSGKQYLYTNRGLGTAIPFRIWMPPEITLITLKKE